MNLDFGNLGRADARTTAYAVGGVTALAALPALLRKPAGAAALAARKAVAKMRHGDPSPYLATIRRAAARHVELQARPALLVGLFDQETRYRDEVVRGVQKSRTGALGIAQFTKIGAAEVRRIMEEPGYARRFDSAPTLADRLRRFRKEPDALDVVVAIEAGALLLAFNIGKYGGVEAGLTAYNAGHEAARIVQRAGSHAAALPRLLALPDKTRSQSPEYAPGVLARAGYFQDRGVA